MKKSLPQELYYNIRNNVNSCVRPEMTAYSIESSKSYFLYAEHFHSEHELILVADGIYKAKLNGQELCLVPGEILIICPGDYHIDAVHSKLRFHAVKFDLYSDLFADKTIRLFRSNINASEQIVRPLTDLRPDFNAVEDEVKTSLPLPQIIRSRLDLIFWRIVRQIPEERLSKPMSLELSGNSFATKLNCTIYENIHSSSLTVGLLASLMGMSPSKLTNLCSRTLNSSPARLVVEVKINVAKRLLLETDMSVKEISGMLNFSDQFVFSRAFKRCGGKSPREYRKHFCSTINN